MRKYPTDVSVSENCIDTNLEMIERRDPDNFPRFPQQEWCARTIPEIALNVNVTFPSFPVYEGYLFTVRRRKTFPKYVTVKHKAVLILTLSHLRNM